VTLEGFPQSLALRDGTLVTVRPLDAADAKAVQAFYRSLPEEDRLYLKDDVTDVGWLQRFVALVASGEVVSLIGEREGKVVAEASLYRALRGWSTHVGELRISVDRALRRDGLGTALARELVKIATRLGIDKVMIEVVENQAGARRMFRRLGFRQEAVLRGHVKDINGAKRNLVLASTDVSHIWDAMEALVADFSPSSE
jgi:L-amino acid N-acyltransferase YncA